MCIVPISLSRFVVFVNSGGDQRLKIGTEKIPMPIAITNSPKNIFALNYFCRPKSNRASLMCCLLTV